MHLRSIFVLSCGGVASVHTCLSFNIQTSLELFPLCNFNPIWDWARMTWNSIVWGVQVVKGAFENDFLGIKVLEHMHICQVKVRNSILFQWFPLGLYIVQGIPSVSPDCVKEKIEESVFSNWQLLSSWGVFLPIQTSISPSPFSGKEATFVQKRKSYFHTDNPTLRRAGLGICHIFYTSKIRKISILPDKNA